MQNSRTLRDYKFNGQEVLNVATQQKKLIQKSVSSVQVRNENYENLAASFAETSKSLSLGKPGDNPLAAVILPDTQESYTVEVWICAHATDFYSDLYTCYIYCDKHYTESHREVGEGFPEGLTYTWEGDHCSGPEYVAFVFGWFEQLINDPKIFVDDDDTPFPLNFKSVISKMFTRMLRILGILILVEGDFFKTDLDQHFTLHTLLKRFLYFTTYWELVDFSGHDAKALNIHVKNNHRLYNIDFQKLKISGVDSYSAEHKLRFLNKYKDADNHTTKPVRISSEWERLLEEDMDI